MRRRAAHGPAGVGLVIAVGDACVAKQQTAVGGLTGFHTLKMPAMNMNFPPYRAAGGGCAGSSQSDSFE